MLRSSILLSFACLSAPFLWACGSSVPPVSMLVGASGGTLQMSDGTTLTIPAGALSADVTITTKGVDTSPPGSFGSKVGQMFQFGPEGQQFAQPVTISLAFDPSKLQSGSSPEGIVVVTSPVGNESWTTLPSTLADSTHVTAQTTHFSYIGTASKDVQIGPRLDLAASSACGQAMYLRDKPNHCSWTKNCGSAPYVLDCLESDVDDAGAGVSTDAGSPSSACNCLNLYYNKRSSFTVGRIVCDQTMDLPPEWMTTCNFQ